MKIYFLLMSSGRQLRNISLIKVQRQQSQLRLEALGGKTCTM